MSVRANFADIYLQGMRDRSMRSETELAREIGKQPENKENWFLWFRREKIVFHRPNYISIQVFQFKISVKTICFDKQNFVLVTSIQFVACALRENLHLSNRSSGVQIPHDICTRFGCYLNSTKYSWIINTPYSMV